MIPTIVLFLHSFCNHDHHICQSKLQSHIHQKEAKCELHLLNHSPFYFDNFPINKVYFTEITSVESLTDNSLINHQQLPFSLIGPPLKVQI